MRDYEYSTPKTMSEALGLLGAEGALALAGGTDLLIHIRAGLKAPRRLVDLSCLNLNYVREQEGLLAVGAMTTFAVLLETDLAGKRLDCLVESAESIGAVQTRNMATIGGNLCSAVPSADSAPPLLALDARVKIAGRSGERVLPLERFFTGPKKSVLQAGEILTEVQIPLPPAHTGTCFYKIGRRKAMTLAIVNVAALLTVEGNVIRKVRVALGAVAPIPMRATQAESLLQDCEISEERIERAASVAVQETTPISDLRATAAYRREVSRVLVKRALTKAWERATR